MRAARALREAGDPEMRTQSLVRVMTPIPFTVAPDDTLLMAHRMMSDHDIRHLPVVSAGRLVGVLSERDVVTWSGHGRPMHVADAMTPEPYVVSVTTPLHEVARHMARRKLGCAVVVQDERVVGVFTTVDALRVLADLLAP